jgi:hypothetical protein
MKVQIVLDHWYAYGNRDMATNELYAAFLENKYGERCCLGFCAVAHGVRPSNISGLSVPSQIQGFLEPDNWMLSPDHQSNLAILAVALNDGHHDWIHQPIEVRMGNLITVFDEGGDDLEFIYKEEPT